MSAKSAQSVELHSQDLAYLEEMVRKYQLSDVGKAIRCLVSHAQEKVDLEPEIFDAIRCRHC